ncbi:MAG: hypothetical protein CVV64_17130 [Candidatus Wallbacteria bacterium HGW-Wallbacteria-1]|jgi:hypothetical protein|uniref:Peptidase M3A/M3B catalytic domain-containing protein n=1 Tax=Candidatus Wallbacteria bacterium HGW-Wallbacteria-1 TaxID=2013854 RepID=A0A2N1PKD1_9BACT|nr:MAG: hypothetical protein CVV64_17130 [Candidatus Wallbacteria bacterium HGW-Wallbacteria-1]
MSQQIISDITDFARKIAIKKQALDELNYRSMSDHEIDIDIESAQSDYHSFVADSDLLEKVRIALQRISADDQNNAGDQKPADELRNLLLSTQECILDSLICTDDLIASAEMNYQELVLNRDYICNAESYSFNQLLSEVFKSGDKSQREVLYNSFFSADDDIFNAIRNLTDCRNAAARRHGFADFNHFYSEYNFSDFGDMIFEISEIQRRELDDVKIAMGLSPFKNGDSEVYFQDWNSLRDNLPFSLSVFREEIPDPVAVVKEFYGKLGFSDCWDSLRIEKRDINVCGQFWRMDPPTIFVGNYPASVNWLNIKTLIHEFAHALEYLHPATESVFTAYDPFTGVSEGIAILFTRLFYSPENLLQFGFSLKDIENLHCYQSSFLLNFELHVSVNAIFEHHLHADADHSLSELSEFYEQTYHQLTGVHTGKFSWMYDMMMHLSPFYGLSYAAGNLLARRFMKYSGRNRSDLINPETGAIIRDLFFKTGGLLHWKKKLEYLSQ